MIYLIFVRRVVNHTARVLSSMTKTNVSRKSVRCISTGKALTTKLLPIFIIPKVCCMRQTKKPRIKPTETPTVIISKPSRKNICLTVWRSMPRLRMVEMSRVLSMIRRDSDATRFSVEMRTIRERIRIMPSLSERYILKYNGC